MYAKIFSSMYNGSLATVGPWEALITFQQFLVLADRFGIVDMTPEVISRVTTVPLEIIRKGIAALEQPDPYSRGASEDGKRIVNLDSHRDWGWQIVNYTEYHRIRSAEERAEYMREYMRERRKKDNAPDTPKAHVKPHQTPIKEDLTPVVATLPLLGGTEYQVHQSLVAEFEPIYPKVDIPGTLTQMRGWCLANPDKCKSPRGIRRFIGAWLAREQERYDAEKR